MSEHVRLWRYRVEPSRKKEFLHHYSTDGTWTQLFQRAHGYLGTTLWQDVGDETTWYTQDHWHSQADFEKFDAEFRGVYAEIDKQLEGVASEEVLVACMNRA